MIFLRNSIFTLLILINFNSPAFSSVLDEIVQNGILKVGTTGDFPGWSFKNPETNKVTTVIIDTPRSPKSSKSQKYKNTKKVKHKSDLEQEQEI